MSYTILTVPFNLKEKAEGDFLKKGFVVDDRIEDYFGKITDNKGYIYGGEFSRSLINKAVVKSFLDLKLENSNTKPRLNYAESQNHVLEKISLYDKKYLKPFEIYTNLNPIERELIPDNDFIKALVNKLDGQGKLIFRTNIADRNTNNQYFKIDSVKIFFNRQNTNKGVGYGFISVTIEWIEDNVSTGLIQQIEPIKEFLRFYGKGDNSSMFLPFFDGKKDKKEQVEHLNNKMDKLAEENVDFSVIAKSIRFSEDDFQLKKGLHFKLIVDELLKFFLADENKFKMAFDFNDRLTKPYLLYLDSTTSFDTSGDGLPSESQVSKVNFQIELNKSIYNLLRIPASSNRILKKNLSFKPIVADHSSIFYCMNEGAYILDGGIKKELVNKYFPAFLFALNQKYLFEYLQNRINELKVNELGEYDIEELRSLKGTLIKAEFSQIFTSISNYNEIALFFDSLRSKFKINELRTEFIASVDGVTGIAQFAERRQNEISKEKEEKEKKNQEDKLNLILLLLTISQVWIGFFAFPQNLFLKVLYFSGLLLILAVFPFKSIWQIVKSKFEK